MPAILLLFVHLALWVLYSLVLILSRHDHNLFESLLLLLFAYFGYLLTVHSIQNKGMAFRITLSSTLLYIAGKWAAVSWLHLSL
ncbi:hypothetical protein ACFFJY_12190 [Fictibacillus aquaticus]|uniref:Uncharacterized protein n=1 Tax=Fictibacillus aquaticus TaxID=2021314 RepID=A0A235FDI6_9BACL|nr:hypothetical protein [Fictibacillus aquaticus]OYD59003.1 hypothetical protein CGZ90_03630 [Fictibacillus aquaticus]